MRHSLLLLLACGALAHKDFNTWLVPFWKQMASAYERLHVVKRYGRGTPANEDDAVARIHDLSSSPKELQDMFNKTPGQSLQLSARLVDVWDADYKNYKTALELYNAEKKNTDYAYVQLLHANYSALFKYWRSKFEPSLPSRKRFLDAYLKITQLDSSRPPGLEQEIQRAIDDLKDKEAELKNLSLWLKAVIWISVVGLILLVLVWRLCFWKR